MSRKQIERAPQTNLADILTQIPGASSYSDMASAHAITKKSQYMATRDLDLSYNAYTLNTNAISGADRYPYTQDLQFFCPVQKDRRTRSAQ